ncbi:MAG: hypothetical protein KY476_00610 [Planctomycetes bacterium]|nr:hypothetical protein [Planctomycetota bacterium]
MATQKSTQPQLVRKNVNFPTDWIERIDRERGQVSFGDFVRTAVLEKLANTRGLSEMPQWGQGRPPKER